MKFNKEKTKKFASGGKTPKEIMEEARRNQAIWRQSQEGTPSAIARDAANTAARDAVNNSGIATHQPTPVTIQVPRREVALKEFKPISFSEAFRRAREAKLKEFDWLDPKTGKVRKIAVKLADESSTEQSTENNGTTSQQSPQQSPQVSIGNTANTLFVGANRTTPIFNTNSGLDLSRLFIPEGQQYGQSQEDTEDTEDTEGTEGKTSRAQLIRIGNPTNTRFNINPNFSNRSGLDLSRLVLPPVLPIRTSAATTVTNRFNTPIIPLGKNPVSRNPYYQQGGHLPSYQQGGKVEAPTDEMYVDFAVRFLSKLGVGEQDMVDEKGGLKDEHAETVTVALQELESTPEFWDTYVSDPDAAVDAYLESKQSPEQIEMAKKGAKLKKLQKLKKGTAKKCKCGCDLTMKKEKGGTITEVCSCGCKAK